MDKKKLPKKQIILLLCSAALLVVNIIFYSLGWFTSNKETEANGMGMQSVDCPFELRVKGSVVLETELENLGYYDGIDPFDDPDTDVFQTSSGDDHLQVKWRTSQFIDPSFGNDKENKFEPGKFGKIDYYIVPKYDGDLTLSISFSFKAFNENMQIIPETADGSGNYKRSEQKRNKENSALQYLSGHLLFFNEVDEHGKFISRITEPFPVTIENATAGQEYLYSVYWVWPDTLGQIIMPERENTEAKLKVLYADDSNVRNDILGNIQNPSNKNMYFDMEKVTDENFDSYLRDIGTYSLRYSLDNYKIMSAAYNEADQKIGMNIRFLLFEITAASG